MARRPPAASFHLGRRRARRAPVPAKAGIAPNGRRVTRQREPGRRLCRRRLGVVHQARGAFRSIDCGTGSQLSPVPRASLVTLDLPETCRSLAHSQSVPTGTHFPVSCSHKKICSLFPRKISRSPLPSDAKDTPSGGKQAQDRASAVSARIWLVVRPMVLRSVGSQTG